MIKKFLPISLKLHNNLFQSGLKLLISDFVCIFSFHLTHYLGAGFLLGSMGNVYSVKIYRLFLEIAIHEANSRGIRELEIEFSTNHKNSFS